MPRISMYYTSTFDAIKDLVKKCSLGVEVLQVGEADGVVTNVFDIQKFGPEVQTPRALMCMWLAMARHLRHPNTVRILK